MYGSIRLNETVHSRDNQYFALTSRDRYIVSVNSNQAGIITRQLLDPVFGVSSHASGRFFNCSADTVRLANLPNITIEFIDPYNMTNHGRIVLHPEDYFRYTSIIQPILSNETMTAEVCEALFLSTDDRSDTFGNFFNPLILKDINLKLTRDGLEFCEALYSTSSILSGFHERPHEVPLLYSSHEGPCFDLSDFQMSERYDVLPSSLRSLFIVHEGALRHIEIQNIAISPLDHFLSYGVVASPRVTATIHDCLFQLRGNHRLDSFAWLRNSTHPVALVLQPGDQYFRNFCVDESFIRLNLRNRSLFGSARFVGGQFDQPGTHIGIYDHLGTGKPFLLSHSMADSIRRLFIASGAQIATDDSFYNCTHIPPDADIILAFEEDRIMIYADEYIERNPASNVCSFTINGLFPSFNPLAVPRMNVRKTQNSLEFCDSAI